MEELFLNYYNQYKSTLTDEVIPYWIKYSRDESGAMGLVFQRTGTSGPRAGHSGLFPPCTTA